MDKLQALSQFFGHKEFRAGQEKIVDSLMSKRDVLCVMPTGGGKSICYQLPAVLSDGVTIVISPLISLMKDQVTALNQVGIKAAFLNSSLSEPQFDKALSNMEKGEYKLVYVAPERLESSLFKRVCKNINISIVAVDEAHCISKWGQDFRPSYRKIANFVSSINPRPVIGAFTATATDAVRDDISSLLKLQNPYTITAGFDRPNLYFGVFHPKNKREELLRILSSRRGKSGIIYCLTRKSVEDVCDLLISKGYNATRYHAGLPESERSQNQEDFVFDRKDIVVATNAFGMGIDKSDVNFVIHYNMPLNVESYYQEAGRAGRDGEKADCILLFSTGDVSTAKFLISHSGSDAVDEEERQRILQKDMDALKSMVSYCNTDMCLRRYILEYFGDNTAKDNCANCSSCLNSSDKEDVTDVAVEILKCIGELNGKFGKTIVCDILHGSNNQKIERFSLNTMSSFGELSNLTATSLRVICDELINREYVISSDGQFPTLSLAKSAYKILEGKEKIKIRSVSSAPKAPKSTKNQSVDTYDESAGLFNYLREVRAGIANELGVPAYIVFSNATLYDMCRKEPTTVDELMDVSGVGRAKATRFGHEFLEAIENFNSKRG